MSGHFSAAHLNSNGPSCATRARQHLYQNFIPNSPTGYASGTLDVCANQRKADSHNHSTPHPVLGPADCSPCSVRWSNSGPWMSPAGNAPYHSGHRLSLTNTGGHISGAANTCAQRDLSGHPNTGPIPLPPKGYNDTNHCRSPILHHHNTIPSDSEFVSQSTNVPSMSSLCSPLADRPKMREPTCKRNPPPPPPPRSGSWLGRTPADVIRQPHHIANVGPHHSHQQQQQPHRPCPPQMQNNQPRLCQQQNVVVSTIPGLQSVPSQMAHFRPFELKTNHTISNSTGSHAPQLSNDSQVTQYPSFPLTTSITPQALPPQTAQFSNCIPDALPSADKVIDSSAIEHPALLPVRAEVTDRLLQLLIRHFSATPVNSVTAPVCPTKDKATLDRLLQTVCSPDSRRLSPSGLLRYVDSQVASVAQRILPHLVRIIYTQLADRGTGLCENECSHFSNDIQPSDGESRFVRANAARGSTEPDLMTTSTDSRLSCTEEEECGREEDDVEETVLDVLDEGYSKPGTELDALPVGTSIAELKNAAIEAIYRLVPLCQPDLNLCERDLGIVRLLVTIHAYSSVQQTRLGHLTESHTCKANEPMESLLVPPTLRCPVAEVAALVRLSFYPEHRAAICDLGGVHALIALLRTEHAVWTKQGPVCSSTNAFPILDAVSPTAVSVAGQNICTRADQQQPLGNIQTSQTGHLLETSIALRRYICMALTNLTFGVPENKALLCRRVTNLEALLAQVETSNEELKQVAASVLRNLCWRTDSRSKLALRRVNAPRRLTVAAMTSQRDSTLRTTLSALWNLSAHCSYNKRAVCGVDGVFPFLLGLLHCQDLANRVVIMENSGGILRNISAVIAGREDYRAVLQQNNCYPILIDLLRNAPSLTVVVNVCGTLWNLTAAPHCPAAELLVLCRLGVVDWLHQLAQSPHELVRNSSTAVLRNLMHPTSLQSDLSTCSSYCTASDTRSTDGLDTVRPTDQPVTSQDLSLSTHTHDLAGHDDAEDDDQKLIPVDQSCRRRSSARARLRFGLLSVVLEANDADEEAAAESEEDEEEEEDEETYGHDEDDDASQTSIYPDQEALVTDESTELLRANATIIQSLPQRPQNTQSLSDCHSWNLSDNEDEQAYVYAEEGTPFPPDSTTASCLDLHQPRTHVGMTRNGDQAAYCSLKHGHYDIAAHQPTTLTSYSFEEAVPQVYGMENTPSQLKSGYLSVGSASSPRLIRNEASMNALLSESSQPEAAHVDDEEADEAPQLPSPPPDVSGLVSPLLSLQLDDDYVTGLTTAFTLPPPPVCVTALTYDSTVVVDESRTSSVVRSPLFYSRGSSSYLSSADLGSLPAEIRSSPQSECSSQPMPHELEFPEGEGSSPGSHAVASHSDSAVEDEVEPVEEELAPLTFSNGDGVEEGNEGEEVKLAFAEEGTPQDAVSLLDELSVNYVLHDRSFDYAFEKTKHQPTVCAQWSNENLSNPVDRAMSLMVEDGDDEDEQGQTHILRQCIASAMPTNVSFALRPEVSNSLKFATSVSEGVLFAQTDDSVQAFAVEDTPFGTSTKTSSLSDLYNTGRKSPIHFTDCHLSTSGRRVCNHKGDPAGPLDDHKLFACINHSSNSTRGIERDGSSNSSSLSGDTSSDLLSEVIQSAMPKSAQTGLLVSCAGPPDGDCLQLYAVEGTPGEDDLSESSMQNMDSSDLNSSISQPSLQCSSTTSPPTTTQPHCVDILQSNPPAPPRRTTSAVSLQKDPFAPTGPSVIRPQATVAPMPQVARCSPTTTEPSDILSVGSDTYEVHKSPFTRETGVFSVVDKDDASSFSSLLSIESVGLEHNLLQECISSAMPRPKLSGPLRKNHPHHQFPLWHQLPSDMCSIEGIPLEQDETPLSNGPQIELEPNPNTVAQPAPIFHSGLPVPGTQLPSIGSSSNVSVEPSSVSILVTDTTEPMKITCIPAPSVAVPNTKRADSKSEHRFGTTGAFHFLDCGSDGAHLPPRHSSPVTKSILAVVPPDRGQLVAHETARKQLCDLGSSEARNLDEDKNNEGCPNGISQLPVRASRLPIISNPLAMTNPAGSTRGRESSGPSATERMVVEGAKTVLAALINGSSDGEPNDLITATSKSSGSARVLPVAERALTSKIEPLHAVRPPASQIPSVSQSSACNIPTRLVQPSRVTKSSASPQSGLVRLTRPKHVTNQPHTSRFSPSLVLGAQNTKTSIVSDKRNPNLTDSVTSKPHRVSVSCSVHSKTVTSTKTALKLPAQHLLPGHRSALTCPSSATVRSPVASRSTSVSGSQTNLHSTTRGLPGSRPVSAHSVCAALARQDRAVNAVLGSKPALSSPTKRIQTTTPNHVYHQVSKTRTPLGSSASTRASLTILNPSDNDSHSTKFGFLSSTELNQLGSTSSNSPKPIRGGRKSLTGRKPSTTVKDPVKSAKPVIRPTVHSTPSDVTSGHLTNELASSSSRPSSSNPPVANSTVIASNLLGTPSCSTRVVPNGRNRSTISPSDPRFKQSQAMTDQNRSMTDLGTDVNEAGGMWIVRGELAAVERVN
ncbi:hypothetical protein PHET_00462 [Paragonimus heterotremus]|uniref:Adenomatous polyposis coli protein n=1 Tax=Paragonimus heterotremus TaxID=100268 RepID=A0A8J4TF25_9TREM|nr:hypothetical protein PHET_00462 [Paragonimus heterotremus]